MFLVWGGITDHHGNYFPVSIVHERAMLTGLTTDGPRVQSILSEGATPLFCKQTKKKVRLEYVLEAFLAGIEPFWAVLSDWYHSYNMFLVWGGKSDITVIGQRGLGKRQSRFR